MNKFTIASFIFFIYMGIMIYFSILLFGRWEGLFAILASIGFMIVGLWIFVFSVFIDMDKEELESKN